MCTCVCLCTITEISGRYSGSSLDFKTRAPEISSPVRHKGPGVPQGRRSDLQLNARRSNVCVVSNHLNPLFTHSEHAELHTEGDFGTNSSSDITNVLDDARFQLQSPTRPHGLVYRDYFQVPRNQDWETSRVEQCQRKQDGRAPEF